jgi:FHIPEP family
VVTKLAARVELGDSLAGLVETRAAEGLQPRLVASLEAHLERLGIPGEATVEIAPARTTRPLRVRIQGEIQPYPPELLIRTWISVAPPRLRAVDPLVKSAESPFPVGWLEEIAKDVARRNDPDGWARLAGFVERLVAQILLEQPSRLLAREQERGFFGDAMPIPDEEVVQLLRRLLDLGVAVGERQLIRELLEDGRDLGRPLEDTVEAAFTELRTHRVAICIHPTTLYELLEQPVHEPLSVYAPEVPDRLQRLFREMETSFVSSFGFLLPDLVWVPSLALPEWTVAVEIGGWWGLPVPMFGRGERFVDLPAEELAGIQAAHAVHPFTGARCAVVKDEDKDVLERDRMISTFGPVDFVILNVLGELSQHPGRLFGLEELEHQLTSVAVGSRRGAVATPVEAALARYSLGELTRIRRELIDERLSLRSLSAMLEALLAYEPASSGNASNGSGPPQARWSEYYEFVRRRLRPYIRHKHAGTGRAITAFRLDPYLEQRVLRLVDDSSVDEEREEIRDAVWRTLQRAGGSGASILVTTKQARPHVRRLIAPELPTLPVIAEEELGPEVAVDAISIEHSTRRPL